MRSCWLLYILFISSEFCRNFQIYCLLADKIEQQKSVFLQKEDNWWKYLSQLLLTSYFWSVSMENYCLFLIVFLHGAHPAFLTTYLISIFCLKLELTTYCFLKVWENIFELEIMKSDSCLTPSPFMLCQHTCRRTIWITLT